MNEKEITIEAKLCVKRKEDGSFNVNRQDINIFDAREILLRIVLFIRNHENGLHQSRTIIDDFKIFTDEPTDEPRVCTVWNPLTRQIRFSVIGLDLWQACILCEDAAASLQMLYLTPEGLSGIQTERRLKD